MELGNLSHSDLDDLPWAVLERPWGTTEMKLVRCSPIRGTYTNIIRLSAGTVLPKHLHTGGVHSFTFKGRWHYYEHPWVAAAGHYVYEPVGTVHTLEVLEDTEALFVNEGTIIWYDGDDRMSKYQDAGMVLDDCVAALKKQGLELPSIVVQD